MGLYILSNIHSFIFHLPLTQLGRSVKDKWYRNDFFIIYIDSQMRQENKGKNSEAQPF